MLVVQIPCILLQVATVWVGGLMLLDATHARTDRVIGGVVCALATVSAILIGR